MSGNWNEVMDVNLLQMSFAGGIMIIVVVLLRAVLIHRLPKRTFLILWSIVLCRLLIPYSLKSSVSIYTFLQKSPVIAETAARLKTVESAKSSIEELRRSGESSAGEFAERSAAESAKSSAEEFAESSVDSSAAEPAEGSADKQNFVSAVVCPLIWLTGLLLCISYFTFSYIRGYRKFRQSLPVESELLQEWYRSHTLKRKLSVRQSDQIAAPLTYGFFRPVILMPKASGWEDRDQTAYILEHEYVHIQRGDAAVKLLIAVAACMHWFNPLVWVMYVLFNRDIELSCDEAVLRRFGEETRTVYARLLIHMEERQSGFAPFGSSFSKTAIEERITAIMKIKKFSLAMTVCAAVLIGSVTAVFATSAATDMRTSEPETGTQATGFRRSAFTDEEYRKLLALQYDGYETMSVAQYQDRVWVDTDTREYTDLLERFSLDEAIYSQRDVNDIAGFLHYTLMPLYGDGWQSRSFLGGAVTDYPDPCDQACFEYTFTMTVLDADKLTVGEYADAGAGMRQKLNAVLENRTEEELQDEVGMRTTLLTLMEAYVEQFTKESLRITVDDWTYRPLVNLTEEDVKIREASLEKSREDWARTLEPYLPLGVTYAYDSAMDRFKMYYHGKEIKSITDEEKGIWIAEYAGSRAEVFAEDAVEMFAVYEDGKLTGLREANAQEAADLAAERARATAEWMQSEQAEAALQSDLAAAQGQDDTLQNAQAEAALQRDLAASDWEVRPPYGTEADYESLLSLKTADYQDMPLEDFNNRLLEWANEDYNRMERINMDTSWNDWQVELSEEEKSFVALTVCASGAENAEFVQSSYTGRPEADPELGEYLLTKSEEAGGGAAWCNLFYGFSYHIPDRSRITVGGRDRCVGGMINAVQAYWDAASLDELLQMEESDIADVLQSLAEEHSNDLISISVDVQRIGFEKMDERVRS